MERYPLEPKNEVFVWNAQKVQNQNGTMWKVKLPSNASRLNGARGDRFFIAANSATITARDLGSPIESIADTNARRRELRTKNRGESPDPRARSDGGTAAEVSLRARCRVCRESDCKAARTAGTLSKAETAGGVDCGNTKVEGRNGETTDARAIRQYSYFARQFSSPLVDRNKSPHHALDVAAASHCRNAPGSFCSESKKTPSHFRRRANYFGVEPPSFWFSESIKFEQSVA